MMEGGWGRFDIAGILAWRPARFLLAGGTAAATHLLTLFLLVHYLHVWYLAAATVGFAIGTAVSFILQKLFTFRDYTRHLLKRQASLHVGLQIWNMCLNALLMYVAVDFLLIPYLIAQFMISLAIAFYNFFFYRRFVFVEGTHPV
jgi:putative flippase GtrA